MRHVRSRINIWLYCRVVVGARVVLFVFLELYLCYIVCDLYVVFIVVMHGQDNHVVVLPCLYVSSYSTIGFLYLDC